MVERREQILTANQGVESSDINPNQPEEGG